MQYTAVSLIDIRFFLIKIIVLHQTWNKKKKVQIGNDQEKAQSERDSHTKNRGVKKLKKQSGTFTMQTHRKPNEQLFSHSVTKT